MSIAPPSALFVTMLKQGMRLSQKKFRMLYEESDLRKVELVNGIVRMPSPVCDEYHGEPHYELNMWTGVYKAHSPNVKGSDNATVHLDDENEVQPDVLLRKVDGSCRRDEAGYLRGPPEFVGEISNSSAHFDSHEKKDLYERCGVKELLIWRTRVKELDWFVLRNGTYHRLEPIDGVIKSEAFPGLVLNATALLETNTSKVLETLTAAINER